MIFEGYIFSIIYACLCLLLGFVLYKLGVPQKITRKIVHILVGFEWVILYYCMGPGLHFFTVCVGFLAVLAFSYNKKLLPMIASDGDNSPGTVYYAVAMSIMSLICIFLPDMILSFGIGVICTSLGDGLAGLSGQCLNFPSNLKIYKKKTLYGTLFNFIICNIAVGVFNSTFNLGLNHWHIIAISIFATELELFTVKGLDNITITLGASFLTYFLVKFDGAENYIIPILLTPIMIAFAHRKKALTFDGIIAALFVDVLISVALGNFGFVLLLTFFLGGIFTDKIKKKYKDKKQRSHSLPECRDSLQVLSNSAIAAVCSLLYFITKEKAFLLAFVATLGEALADTSASGIGVLSGRAYDPFRMKACPVGISGGMSLLGTFSSLLGALIISLIAFTFGYITIIEAVITAICAFLGAIFDSFLGSFAQVKYKCKTCGALVERKEHCGSKTIRFSGCNIITNDTVNFLATLFAAVLSFIIFIYS